MMGRNTPCVSILRYFAGLETRLATDIGFVLLHLFRELCDLFRIVGRKMLGQFLSHLLSRRHLGSLFCTVLFKAFFILSIHEFPIAQDNGSGLNQSSGCSFGAVYAV